MSDNIIRINNLTKQYVVDGKTVSVFKDLNMKINAKDITVLIGKSGCGKTTLLRLLAGLEKPTSGEIIMPDNLKIGMMFQEARLMPWLTCEKNVTLGMKADRKSSTNNGVNSGVKTSLQQQSDEILKLVGLEGFEKAYPVQLSGGMQQRAALARTLIRKSNLILMDEPFGALDSFTRRAMQQELLRIRKETDAGIVFVTHDMTEAVTIGDKVITVKKDLFQEVET